ncbi:glycosyltransferase [Curvibacter gracilis]|uniref:glycosyltransferase n=1 Tax=Curvibacter gracilis TaxID=230310 RepID=UPI0004870CFD|nr:glycosyltransferase [Curvibacter gracilis]
MKYSVVIPIYGNEESLPDLFKVLSDLNTALDGLLEAVFVIDGSPDRSFERVREALPHFTFAAQLLVHSRNFGSFAAIRTGLATARGTYFGVMAADLQEPPQLLLEFFDLLDRDVCDVVLGTRISRKDPLLSRMTSGLFWALYRRWIVPEMPPGGVDIFGCNREFKEQILKLEESRSSLIALIFWLGFRRELIGYERRARVHGKSAWSFRKKAEYMLDSVFAFTDYPIRLLIRLGSVGVLVSLLLSVFVVVAKISGLIPVPGYAATMLTVLFLGGLNLLGIGVVGNYAWRTYENTKQRPLSIVARKFKNDL